MAVIRHEQPEPKPSIPSEALGEITHDIRADLIDGVIDIQRTREQFVDKDTEELYMTIPNPDTTDEDNRTIDVVMDDVDSYVLDEEKQGWVQLVYKHRKKAAMLIPIAVLLGGAAVMRKRARQ